MAILNSIDNGVKGAVSLTGNALNLADNILDNDTIVGDFLDMGEDGDFISGVLKGIKDFLHTLSEVYGFLKNIINKALEFINKILSYLDLNNLFDALGIKKFADLIIRAVSIAVGSGYITDRLGLLSLLRQGCIDINDSNPLDNPLFNITLGVILLGLACSGESNSYTLLDKTLKHTHTEESKVVTDGYDNEITAIYGLDSADPTVKASAIASKDAILAKKQIAVEDLAEKDYKVDLKLARTFPLMLANSKPETTESVFIDMSKIPAFDIAKDTMDTTAFYPFIDKIDENLDKSSHSELDKMRMTQLNYEEASGMLDRVTPVNPGKTYRPSKYLSTLARIDLKNEETNVSSVSPIDNKLLATIKPREFSIGEVKC